MARSAAIDQEVIARPATRGRSWQKWREAGQAYLYLLPALVILGVFSYLPSFAVFYISLFRWNFLIHGDQPFVGLANFVFLLNDKNFWQSFWTTVTYVAISVPLHVILSLFLALLLMSGLRGKGLWRLLIFLPFVTPLVATVNIWYWMFDYYHGLFNGLLHIFHQPPIDWLHDHRWILPSIIFYTTWKSIGFSVVIFMAGLANQDPSLSEAAQVDGANAWQVFQSITFPTLLPITIVVTLLSTIEAFKMFQPVFLLAGSGGGPLNAARTLGLYLYEQAFVNTHDGLGAAISVVIFLIVFTVAAAQLFVSNRFQQ